MKTLLTLLISCFFVVAAAQVPEPAMLWLKGYGGNGANEVVTQVTKTADDGLIIGISSNSSIGSGNIDSLCDIGGNRSIFVKYNSDASVLEWSMCYLGNGDTGLQYMYPQNDGGTVFGGEYLYTYDWGFYICKQNAIGNILWSHSYAVGESPLLFDMIATSDGGYMMIGDVYYTDTNFTVHNSGSMNADIGVLKLDSLGNKIWSKAIGGSENEEAVKALEIPGGGYYITGTTLSNDYDCTGNHGGDDVYLVRLDYSGNIVWHNDIGGSGGDQGNYAYADGKGGVVIAGASNSPDGDRTHFPSYGCPVWVLQVDSNNNILWNNCYGGGGSNCYPNAICKAIDGSIWIAGVSTLIGGQVDTQYGHDDSWFLHISDTGDVINAKVLGSSLDDRGLMVYPLSNGNVIGGGFYSWGDGTFNSIFSGTYGSSSDAFLTVFGPSPEKVTSVSAVNNSVKIYPNPANEIITIKTEQTGNYDLVITDEIGHQIYTARIIEKIEISVNDWVKGMYYVQVINSDGYKEVQKLVIE